jgi:Fe-S-cluster containining protein
MAGGAGRGRVVELLIPEGINYECTGCGKCCSGWSVPMTEADYQRVSSVDWSSLHESYRDKKLFREMKKSEREGTPYAYKIVSETGVCPFLVNNLCYMHSMHGAEFKPSICQQFPYLFNETPSGIYLSVSFVSIAVIYNTGTPLAEQRELMERKLEDFRRLYPDYRPDWSQIKLTVNQPLTWDEYIQIEQRLLDFIRQQDRPLEERMLAGSAFLMEQVKTRGVGTAYDTTLTDANLKALDRSLLLTFHKMYYPTHRLRRDEASFSLPLLLGQHFFGSKKLQAPKRSFSIEEAAEVTWPDDPELNNILERYFYSYIFGKKYFGAGYAQVSVIAGFHHLTLILALLKLQAKISARLRDAHTVNLLDLAASVRQMERQLGETKLDGYSAAAFETLLYSHERARRLLSHC